MSDRKVLFRYSDDGGRNWTNWREQSLGEQGEYRKRIRYRRLGQFRSRIFQIQVSSPIKRDLMGAVAYMEGIEG